MISAWKGGGEEWYGILYPINSSKPKIKGSNDDIIKKCTIKDNHTKHILAMWLELKPTGIRLCIEYYPQPLECSMGPTRVINYGFIKLLHYLQSGLNTISLGTVF